MKLLSIGNSFSQDAHGFLHDMFKSVGVDALDVKYVPDACDDANKVNAIKNAVNTVLKGE